MYMGSSRAGSTYLYYALKEHPRIKFPIKKPVRFWNRHIDGGKSIGEPNMYEVWSLDWYLDTMASKPGWITGDITDGYIQIPVFRIKQIKDIFPDIKILYCIRNPYDIIKSHLGLKQFLGPNKKYINKNDAENYLYYNLASDCNIVSTNVGTKEQYTFKNINFAENIRKWRDVFGENMYIYSYEDLNNDPYNTIYNIVDFIGVNAGRLKEADPEIWNTKINKRRVMYEYTNEAANWLKPIINPIIDETQDLIDINISHWKK